MPEPAAAAADDTRAPITARCALHRDVAAVHECSRCGDYHCATCHKSIGGRALCATCRALPGIDYLEETRARYWGKRDAFVWYYGLFSLLAISKVLLAAGTGAVRQVYERDAVAVVESAVWVPIALAYLILYRPARAANIAYTALTSLISVARFANGTDPARKLATQVQSVVGTVGLAAFTIGVLLLSMLLAIAAYRSPRNKLAFRIAIDERELQQVYATYASNPLAIRAAWASVVTAFIPLAGALSLGMGIVALRRVDAKAWPPRSGRMPAILAIGVSSASLLAWGTFMVSTFMTALRAVHH